jgi:hypothetical protein
MTPRFLHPILRPLLATCVALIFLIASATATRKIHAA